MDPIRIMLADDHPAFTAGIRAEIEKEDDMEVVGEAGNGIEALQLAREIEPDILLLDMEMPGLSGLEVAQQLHAEGTSMLVLPLSGFRDPEYVFGVHRLPACLRLALFRIYQGALSNVARHAQARHVQITLTLDERHVTLTIDDDGRGFIVPKSWILLARQQHYGLLGISEWAEAAGGNLTVQSAPGKGTLVQVTVPRPRPGNQPTSLLQQIIARAGRLFRVNKAPTQTSRKL